jgi:RNA polymerase sigma-70 factor (ECF subfamily)
MRKRKIEMQDEQVLVDRISSGDSRAFQDLVEGYKKKVYYIAYDITGDHNDAEDISQEVFLKVFRSLKTFRRNAKLSSWLYQISVNASIDLLRKKSSKPEKLMDNLERVDIRENLPGSSAHAQNPERSAENIMIQHRISQALQKISPKERSVFVMRHYNEFKIREIAEILNVSSGTVKALFYRATRKLRKELSLYLGYPGLEVSDE